MKTVLLCICGVFLSTLTNAQYQINFLGGFHISQGTINYRPNSFVQDAYEKLNRVDYDGNFSIAVQLRKEDRWSVELGCQALSYSLDLNTIQTTFGATSSNIGFEADYTSLYLTTSRYYYLRSKFNYYFSIGPSFNFLSGNSHKIDSYQVDGDTYQFELNAKKSFVGFVAEVGINSKNLFIGYRYNQAFGKVYDCNFVDYSNGQIKATDYLSSIGIYSGVVIRYGFGFKDVNLNIFSHQKFQHIYKLNKTRHEEK